MFALNGQEETVALRWYSPVVDCRDVSGQANWWAAALGWKKVYEVDRARIARLIASGATRVNVGQEDSAIWVVLADPEGNEFCVLSARDR